MPASATSDKPVRSRRGRVVRRVAAVVAALLVVVLVGGYLVYRHLDANIGVIPDHGLGRRPSKIMKPNVPQQPVNILLLGSDTRKGQSGHIGGLTPGLSDTAIVLHVSADRNRAYAVSIPRDSMVDMPPCERDDGTMSEGGLNEFNEGYAIGGATCTVKTVEHLTHIRMDHFVVIDFDGFKTMVDALGGVQICVPEDVDDTAGHIHLDGGTYTVRGEKALDYVRIRHVISPNSDYGRMARQQAFLASMTNKAVSTGTLANPFRLVHFLDAATKAIKTDEDLAHLDKLTSLAKQLKGIGLDHVKFLTVPYEDYPPDHNRAQWMQPEADKLWRRLNNDEPLNKKQASASTSASAKKKHSKSAAERAAANGLCA